MCVFSQLCNKVFLLHLSCLCRLQEAKAAEEEAAEGKGEACSSSGGH